MAKKLAKLPMGDFIIMTYRKEDIVCKRTYGMCRVDVS